MSGWRDEVKDGVIGLHTPYVNASFRRNLTPTTRFWQARCGTVPAVIAFPASCIPSFNFPSIYCTGFPPVYRPGLSFVPTIWSPGCWRWRRQYASNLALHYSTPASNNDRVFGSQSVTFTFKLHMHVIVFTACTLHSCHYLPINITYHSIVNLLYQMCYSYYCISCYSTCLIFLTYTLMQV